MRFGKSPRQPSRPQPPQKPMIGGSGLGGLAQNRPVAGTKPVGAGAGFGQGNAMTQMSALSSLLQGKPMKKGGFVKSADGCVQRGKTKGRMV